MEPNSSSPSALSPEEKLKGMKYLYIVVYSFQGGVGRIQVYRDQKVQTEAQFNNLEKFVREEQPELEKLFIMNLIELRKKPSIFAFLFS